MESTIFLIPCYGYQEQLDMVLRELEGQHVVVVDDGSPTVLHADTFLIRHAHNKGYGAAQKTGFQYALSNGFEKVVLVHGDNQYSVALLKEMAKSDDSAHIQLGSRLLGEHSLMPGWRKWGNRFLTNCVNQRYRSSYTDLHTGGRIYSRDFLTKVPYFSFSNDFLFDHQMLIWAIQNDFSMQEFSIPAKYDASVSSISFLDSIRYGLGCLKSIYFSTSRRSDPKTPQD